MHLVENPWIRFGIARVLDSLGRVQGAAFLIDDRILCTCAHVVADALGVDRYLQVKPAGKIAVDFPFLGCETYITCVDCWLPISERGEGDVATLWLLDQPPATACPVRFVPEGGRFESRVCVYGFPVGADYGVWAYGTLEDRRADGSQQIVGSDEGYWVERGFSGAPVWDIGARAVVGMAVAFESDREIREAFLLHVETIQSVFKDIRTLNVSGPFAEFTRGVERIRSPAGIEQFLQEYLGTPEHPVPFGGRKEEIQKLEEWLFQCTKPYAALITPAGRGKSALLTRWLDHLIANRRANVAFVPISIRFGTASREATLGILGGRIRALVGIRAEMPSSATGWLAELDSVLREERSREESPLLIVIDGLDEAVGWDPVEEIRFPPKPARGVKILIAARILANRDANDWIKDLGWSDKSSVPFCLPPLTRTGLQEIVAAFGGVVTGRCPASEIIDQLLRVTRGDPLLVRLYIDALSTAARTGDNEFNLSAIDPGIEGFFDRWWRDQRKQWGTASPLKEEKTRALLNLLACAVAPLRVRDLVALSTGQENFDGLMIEELIQSLCRLLVGDGHSAPLSFSHSRLRDYFFDKFIDSLDVADNWERRFISYGRRVLEDLQHRRITPEKAPKYCVENYRIHLERANAGLDDFAALLDRNWMAAWEANEGSFGGFLSDVAGALVRAMCIKGKSSDIIQSLTVQCRAILIETSINSIAGNLPPNLIKALVRHELWSPEQAVAYARQSLATGHTEILIASVAPFMSKRLLLEIIPTVTASDEQFYRDKALLELIGPLLNFGETELAFQVCYSIEDLMEHGDALTLVAMSFLESAQQSKCLDIVAAIRNPWSKAYALKAVAPMLDEEGLRSAVEIARGNDRDKGLGLLLLVPFLGATERLKIFEEAVADYSLYHLHYGEVPRVLDLLSDEERRDAVKIAFQTAHSLGEQRLEVEAWQKFNDESDRDQALTYLLPYSSLVNDPQSDRIPPNPQDPLFDARPRALAQAGRYDDALQVLRDGMQRGYNVEELFRIFKVLPSAYQDRALSEAMEDTLADNNKHPRDLLILAILAPGMEGTKLYEEAIRRWSAMDRREQVGVIELFPGRQIKDSDSFFIVDRKSNKLIGITRSPQQQPTDTNVLGLLKERFSDRFGTDLLAIALREEKEQGKLISIIAPYLNENELERALDAACELPQNVSWMWDLLHNQLDGREMAISGLAPYLSPDALYRAVAMLRSLPLSPDEQRSVADLASIFFERGKSLRAMTLIEELKDPEIIAQWLAKNATRLSKADLESVIRLVNGLPQEVGGDVIIKICSLAQNQQLDKELRLSLLERATSLRNTSERARAIARIAAGSSPQSNYLDLYYEVLDLTGEITDENEKRYILAELAEGLPEELLTDLIAAARNLQNPLARGETLTDIARHLDQQKAIPVLGEAILSLNQVEAVDFSLEWAIGDLARALLSVDLIEEAISLTDRLKVNDQIRLLLRSSDLQPNTAKAQRLTEHLRSRAEKIEHPEERRQTLWAIEQSDTLSQLEISEQLSYAQDLNEPERKNYLLGLAPFLPESAVRDYLSKYEDFGDSDEGDSAMYARWSELGHAEEALRLLMDRFTGDYDQGYFMCHTLQAIAPHLPAESLQPALDLAAAIFKSGGGRFAKGGVLVSIIRRIAQIGGVTNAIELTQHLPEWDKVKAFEAINDHLPDDLLPQVVGMILDFTYDKDRESPFIEGLNLVATRLVNLDTESLDALWPSILRAIRRWRRPVAISALKALEPVIHKLSGDQGVQAIGLQTVEIASWFDN